MPDEGATHDATWMSLAVSEDIWGDDLVNFSRVSGDVPAWNRGTGLELLFSPRERGCSCGLH